MNSGSGAVFQSLLHDSLLATAHVESCALFRKKDDSVKAASAGYQVWKLLACKYNFICPTWGSMLVRHVPGASQTMLECKIVPNLIIISTL
jgi:hypothetical protein